ncbi:MAG: hypothetical protein QOD32_706 [Pyrinomonadaceae bacterium]|jgi:hypothetical protein|nr:hypothetical protein [Pyrinomonadaceae bacterium]
MKFLLLAPLLAVTLASGQTLAKPPARAESPADFAARFYRTYLKLKMNGLPDDRQYRSLAPLLSPDLRRLIEAARVEQTAAIKAHPDEKPPWIDGDLFTSLHEGAQSFRVGRPTLRGEYADVPVRLAYRRRGVTRWEDTLVLIRTPAGWRVWDIKLNGDWQFKNGDSLRAVLAPNQP